MSRSAPAERRLLADEVRYDERDRQDVRQGQRRPDRAQRATPLFGDEVEVTGDLRDGFVQAVGMLLKDDSRIAANAGRRAATAT